MRPATLFLSVLLFVSCSGKRGPTTVVPSFYYWSTHYKITGTDSVFLQQAGCRKMYVRFFDVGFSDSWEGTGEIIPKGRLLNDQAFIGQVETVPVVYIENEIFQGHQTIGELEWLSSKMTTKLFRMAYNHGLSKEKIKEIQLDCDWTDKTRENYFAFLKIFRKQCNNKKISVTLRLYQYKYRERSGVPPVDRCMLMYYNMSKLEDVKTKNYVLDNVTGAKYVKDIKPYPLPLDFALPVYHQGVRFYSGDSSFVGLQEMSLADTVGQKIISVDPKAGNMHLLEKSYGYYLTRFEFVTPENLEEASRILYEAVNTDTFSVSFFHLDERLYKPIGDETFKAVIDRLGGRQ